jgi:hypothetical protein
LRLAKVVIADERDASGAEGFARSGLVTGKNMPSTAQQITPSSNVDLNAIQWGE